VPLPSPRGTSLSTLFDGPGWVALRVTTDVAMLLLGSGLALLWVPASGSPWPLALFPAITLLLLESGGRYRQRMRDAVLDSAGPGIGAISTGAMIVLALIAITGGEAATSAQVVLWTWIVAVAGVTLTAMSLIAAQRALRRRGLVERRTLIVGADATGRDMAARLLRMPQYGLRPIGFLDPDRSLGAELPLDAPPLLGALDDLATIAATHRVRNVIICFPEACHHATLELVARCDALGLETTVIPRLSAAVNSQTRFEYLGVQPLLNLRAVDREGWRFGLKHAVDRLLAAVALLLLSPLLLALGALVRVSSPGPVLFRQERTGRDGRVFELLKFRTMVEADEAAIYEMYPEFVPRGIAPGGVEGTDRRTRVGRLLRRTSLDELPQLVNVLRGEMSLVGPRPERPEFAEIFRHEVERYHDRQRVRAGITGWAQVHGLRGQTPLSERVELDNFYIEHWSLALDMKIMLLTLPALLRGS
jgi:exopolysaccharide biosynthesis polyprenyl glycosylphosphotransferase